MQVNGKTQAWTFEADDQGGYGYWIGTREAPLQVVASMGGYVPQSKKVSLVKGKTSVADFTLREVGC